MGMALLLIFLSRLPFLLPGFGAEEDAWGLYYIARKVATTGIYEVSRLPGHPLQEYIYLLIWPLGAPAFNTLTALFSTAAAGFFMIALKQIGVPRYIVAGIVLSFVPVVYINSCNAMDYMWAMAFLMGAFYLVTRKKWWAAGLLVGLATACRITSLAMLLPFAAMIVNFSDRSSIRAAMKMSVAATATGALFYLPALVAHGPAFFGYTAQVPVSWPKAFFNATIGVWGVIGLVDLVVAAIVAMRMARTTDAAMPAGLRRACVAAFAVFILAYLALPQKAAFFIPALPFAVILMAWYLPGQFLTVFSFSMIFSSFFLGINLNDERRGTPGSAWSFDFRLAGKDLVIDALQGPVIADNIRRQNKMAFSANALDRIESLESDTPSVVIAGFWSSDILAKTYALPRNVRLVYYVPEDTLATLHHSGSKLYYLPEQNDYNDRAFEGAFTDRYAEPLMEP